MAKGNLNIIVKAFSDALSLSERMRLFWAIREHDTAMAVLALESTGGTWAEDDAGFRRRVMAAAREADVRLSTFVAIETASGRVLDVFAGKLGLVREAFGLEAAP